MKSRPLSCFATLPLAVWMSWGGAALAQDAPDAALTDPGEESLAREPTEPVLFLDLNTAEPVDGGCRLTFLVTNDLPADLAQLSLETVILTTTGAVERLTLFDFRDIPQSRPRVRQFDLQGVSCDAIGQVLINGAAVCDGTGITPDTCVPALRLTSRAAMELIG